MTKSRMLPALFLVAITSPLPAGAQPLPIAVQGGVIVAPPDPLGDIAARQRSDEERCRRGDPDAVVVCGRLVVGGGGYRVPWRREPGARVRLIAGEVPSATAAMGAGGCLRLCYQPVMIDVVGAVRGIGRGIDRILHPD